MRTIEATTVMSEDELEFVIFCIENLALRHGKDGLSVYAALKDKSGILYDYIVPGFCDRFFGFRDI